MLVSFDVYSWLVTYTQNVEEIKLGISKKILCIIYNSGIQGSFSGRHFLVPSSWCRVQH